MKTKLLLLLLVVLASAVYAQDEPTWTRDITFTHSVEKDEFDGSTRIKMQWIHTNLNTDATHTGNHRLFLRHHTSFGDDVQLYVRFTSYHDDRDHYKAIVKNGNTYSVTDIQWDSDCNQYRCAYIEDVGLEMTITEMRLMVNTMSTDGILIRFYGKNGDDTIFVPKQYMQAFLDAYDTEYK